MSCLRIESHLHERNCAMQRRATAMAVRAPVEQLPTADRQKSVASFAKLDEDLARTEHVAQLSLSRRVCGGRLAGALAGGRKDLTAAIEKS